MKFQEISITSLLFCTDYFLISVGFLFQVTDAPKRGLIVGGIVKLGYLRRLGVPL